MTKIYSEELNSLVFSEEEKTDILERLTLSLTSQALTEKTASANETPAEKKTQNSRLTLPIILLLLFSLVGGTAYAVSEGLVEIPAPLKNIFGQSQNSEIVGKVGYPLGMSVSDAGITMTAETVIGDRTNIAVLYSLRRDSGEPFPLTPKNMDGSLAYSFGDPFDDYYEDDFTEPPLAWGSSSASTRYFYEDENDPTTIYYVELFSASTDSFVDENYTNHYENLGLYENPCLDDEENLGGEPQCSEDFTILAKGSWDFSFTVKYNDMTKHVFPFGATIGSGDGKVTITKVYISPLSVRFIGFAHHRNFGGTIGTEESNEPEIEKIELVMRDGDVKEFAPGETWTTGSTRTFLWTSWEYSQMWGEVIDINEVRAVRINDVEISLD